MTAQSPVLEILKTSDNPHADHALVEGLSRAEPAYHRPIVEALLARESKVALTGLVASFHQLDESLQRFVVEHSDPLFGVLRVCIKDPVRQTRCNALDLIGQIGNYRLAYLLSLALHDPMADLRRQAADQLHRLADRFFRQERVTLEVLAGDGREETDQASVQAYSLARLAEERTYLVTAVTEAAGNYDVHRRPEVAEAVMWFAEHINDALWRAVANRLSACGRAVLAILDDARDPRMVPFFYEALGHRDLRPAAARALSEQRDSSFMQEFVRWSFLRADPRVRHSLASVRSLAWLSRGSLPVLELEPELYPHAVGMVLAMSLSVERKVSVCRDLLMSDVQAAQWAGLWGLIDIDHPASTQLIRAVVRWDDPELAGIALREMMRRCPEDMPSVMADQVDSESPAIREMAGEEVSDYGFDQYWQSFDEMPEEERHELGEALLRTGEDVVATLRRKLASSRSEERLRAVRVVLALDLSGPLEEDIYRIAYDSDTFVRSSVMRLLGRLPGPTSERILLNGLNDPDDRVQANSIESLERLRASGFYKLVRRHLKSQDNRVRGNAVRALLAAQAPEAGIILLEMLDDEQASHRASALWVIESLKLLTLAARVVNLARSDPDPTVRRRAARAVASLAGGVPRKSNDRPSAASVKEAGS